MIHTANTVRTLQAVAMSVGLALLLWSTGLPTLFRFAEAASITDASDTLSNSAPGLTSDHTIGFTAPNGLSQGQTFTVTFPGAFTMGSVAENDIDILVNGSASTTGAVPGVDTWGVVVSGQVITFTTPSNSGVASDTPIVVLIGDNATGGSGNDQITNPGATTSYAIDIAGTMQDSGQVRVAIVDQITVSANVDTSLTFAVGAVAGGQSVNGTSTNDASTATTIPFGTLPVGQTRTFAHDLTVSTNASQGYTVTVVQSGALQSTTGDTIDGFIDGLDTATPTVWQAPGGLVADPDTYGHWGLTTTDTVVPARAGDDFGSNEWVSGSTTPVAVMGHTGPAAGAGPEGAARIGYQVQISALQEAGDDYSTTLRYIATPTF